MEYTQIMQIFKFNKDVALPAHNQTLYLIHKYQSEKMAVIFLTENIYFQIILYNTVSNTKKYKLTSLKKQFVSFLR